MEKKIVIYEPPMCCSTGLCGPDPDNTLIELQNSIEKLKDEGIEVERYMITQSPEKFKENPEIIKLIQAGQLKALPITTCDGEIVKTGAYPTLEEFKMLINKK